MGPAVLGTGLGDMVGGILPFSGVRGPKELPPWKPTLNMMGGDTHELALPRGQGSRRHPDSRNLITGHEREWGL